MAVICILENLFEKFWCKKYNAFYIFHQFFSYFLFEMPYIIKFYVLRNNNWIHLIFMMT